MPDAAAPKPKDIPADQPPPPGTPLEPYTCPWAKDGLAKAIEGLGAVSASGVIEYHIGSRGLKRLSVADQGKAIDWWSKWCELLCPDFVPLPTAITGRDTAFRVIPRDL